MNDNGSTCLVTVDGTDFRICEPTNFDKKWFSHKFNGPGVRYEIGICIQTGWIVWINGPFPCGTPDLCIARNALIFELDQDEMYLADGGYNDGNQFSVTPSGNHTELDRMKSVARARHEAVNSLFKNYGILEHRYRHCRSLHGRVFSAIANIIQLTIMKQGPVFQVDYYDGMEI
jgi:hypothetical protein